MLGEYPLKTCQQEITDNMAKYKRQLLQGCCDCGEAIAARFPGGCVYYCPYGWNMRVGPGTGHPDKPCGSPRC